MVVGKLVREGRLKANLSQGHLAAMCEFTNPQFISNIERGKCGCPIELAFKLSKFLKITKQRFEDAMVADYRKHFNEKWGE